MPKKARSGSFRHAEQILYNYHVYKEELADLEKAIADPAVDNTMPKNNGKPGDATSARAIRMMTDNRVQYLKNCVNAVENWLFELSEMKNGASYLLLIKLVYWDRTCTLEAACRRAHYSYAQGKNIRSRMIRTIASSMGW